MNKEEILKKAQANSGFDEGMQSSYQKAYVIGAAVSLMLCSVFIIYEAIRSGNGHGYVAVVMAQMGVSGLIFGKRAKGTDMGKLYFVVGIVCSVACILNFILFFVKG